MNESQRCARAPVALRSTRIHRAIGVTVSASKPHGAAIRAHSTKWSCACCSSFEQSACPQREQRASTERTAQVACAVSADRRSAAQMVSIRVARRVPCARIAAASVSAASTASIGASSSSCAKLASAPRCARTKSPRQLRAQPQLGQEEDVLFVRGAERIGVLARCDRRGVCPAASSTSPSRTWPTRRPMRSQAARRSRSNAARRTAQCGLARTAGDVGEGPGAIALALEISDPARHLDCRARGYRARVGAIVVTLGQAQLQNAPPWAPIQSRTPHSGCSRVHSSCAAARVLSSEKIAADAERRQRRPVPHRRSSGSAAARAKRSNAAACSRADSMRRCVASATDSAWCSRPTRTGSPLASPAPAFSEDALRLVRREREANAEREERAHAVARGSPRRAGLRLAQEFARACQMPRAR